MRPILPMAVASTPSFSCRADMTGQAGGVQITHQQNLTAVVLYKTVASNQDCRAARYPWLTCSGVSPTSPTTSAMVRPHSLFSPTATTSMRPLPSVTWHEGKQ